MMLGNYELTHLLGEGGMAQLYLATERGREGLVRRVVVKRILPSLLDDPKYTQLLIDEARVDALVQHPNVVQLYSLQEASGSHFLVLEWVDGMDAHQLANMLYPEAPRLPRQIALFVALEALYGAHAAHSARGLDGKPLNIVHRDLSPSNVLLSRGGAVKVSDFGIAKWHAQTTKTRTGELKGKFLYMSPEQAMGRPVDARSDVYALGLLLFEWLTGERANPGSGHAEALVAARDGALDLTPLQKQPSDIAEVIRKAVAKATADRFESADAFAKALRNTQTVRLGIASREELGALVNAHARMPPLLTSEIPWEEAGPDDKTPALTPSVTKPTQREPETEPDAQHAIWLVPFVVAVVVVVGALGWRLWTRSRAPVEVAKEVFAAMPPVQPTSAPVTGGGTEGIPEPLGFLSVNAKPWAIVYVDGVRLKGNTPIVRFRVKAGRHALRVESPGLGKSRELVVDVSPDEHVAKVVDFTR